MTQAEKLQYATEFVGVFAPALPPPGWEQLIAEMDNWTDRTVLFVDELLRRERDRLHCQHDDCYRLADVADVRTSLHYCHEHYRAMRNRYIILAANDSRNYHE